MLGRRLIPLALALIATSIPAAGIIPEVVPDLPVLGQQAHRGNDLIRHPIPAQPVTLKVADGDISDWTGEISRFGGTALYSAGEFVYQDYLMDDRGADDGGDYRRAQITDATTAAEPRTYRIEILPQALGEQFGAEGPSELVAPAEYGDAAVPGPLQDHADIVEARVAADDDALHILVRTASMHEPAGTAVVVLLDTVAGGEYPAPGVTSTGAEYAILAIGNAGSITREGELLACGCVTVASNPTDFTNAVEISIGREAFEQLPEQLGIAIAAGVSENGATLASVKPAEAASDLINVAFRYDEPTRIWMDRDQAFALYEGSIDRFMTQIDLSKLLDGYSESFEPRPGYYERIYVSDSPVVRESSSNSYHQGTFQQYGVYLPSSYRPGSPTPATWWTHYRGGHAHDAAAWVPGLIRQLGEQQGNIVITPGARGTSSWYVGRGHEDFLEAWDDSMAAFSIDPDRVYMSGYSMGGYASWLLPLVYPDRFAGAFPTAGPPTQGLWDGVGVASSGANDGRAAEQLTFDIIGNAANLGYVIYHGTSDELVPVSGPIRMASQLALDGYQFRLYLFPGAEHYTLAVIDDWGEAAAYLNTFKRDPNPPRVVYTVKPSLELATETVSIPAGAELDYAFDGAFWVDGLVVRDGDPADAATVGTIDAITLGRGMDEMLRVPEAGALGQPEAYVMTGQRWVRNGWVAPANSFSATLTNLASAELDLARMGLGTASAISASVTSDGAVTLRLAGAWAGTPEVTVCAGDACEILEDVDYQDGVLSIGLGSGTFQVSISP